MTSNIWIENALRRIPSFLGVYSSDNIPPPKFFPSSCIVNFSPQQDIGTHFITLLYDTPYCCRYFDPLDLNFIPQNISEHLKTCPYNVRTFHTNHEHKGKDPKWDNLIQSLKQRLELKRKSEWFV